MKIWIVRAIFDYECDNIIAVFDSEDKALGLKKLIEDNPSGYDGKRLLGSYDRIEIDERFVGWISEEVALNLMERNP